VAKEVLGAGADEAFRERWRLSQEEPRVVVERRLSRHPLELIQGRDDVEDAETFDGLGIVERHAIGDTTASIVADDREALEPEPRHEIDELGRHLALAVALTQGAARRGAALAVALEVADHDGVPPREHRRDAMPAVVGLREAM
jgi:hypothetical protein